MLTFLPAKIGIVPVTRTAREHQKCPTFYLVEMKHSLPKWFRLALACLLAMAALAGLNYHIDAYNTGAFTGIMLSGLIAFSLIYFADKVKHDYYFSGLIDGLMVLQFGLVWGLG